jgi:hypothetical protein
MPLEGQVMPPEQRERVREAAFRREATIRQKVSVNGVVYDNFSQAAAATGISPRSVRRYAREGVPRQAMRNKLLSPEQYALALTIKLHTDKEAQ